MNKLQVALHSPAFWSLVALFIYHGLEGIAPSLGGNVGTLVQSILGLLTLYLHPTEVHTAGNTGMIGGSSIK